MEPNDRDAPGGNPLVAGFQDDLDLDDRPSGRPSSPPELVPSKNITLSSEEEEEEEEQSSKKSSKSPEPAASTKAPDPKTPFPTAQLGFEQNSSSAFSMTILHPEAAPAAASLQPLKVPSHSKASASRQKGDRVEESESDPEGPIATQMLSFVMDDPDFESEESDSQKKRGEEFPVREDLSDISDEEIPPKLPQPAKPIIHSFKMKNDSDLFGLGLGEPSRKESSDEDKEKQSSKEKKKKKKRNSKE
ncbi:hypothetical protein JD844_005113, partial [Phrynosoma platyrhinos]